MTAVHRGELPAVLAISATLRGRLSAARQRLCVLEKGWGAKQRPTAAIVRVVVTPHSIQGSMLPNVQSAKAALFMHGAVPDGIRDRVTCRD